MDNDNIDEMVSSVLKVLSNPLRIKVVLVLREGEKRVSEIADRTNCHQANLARHLNELKIIDFIESRREGQSKYYRFNPIILEYSLYFKPYCSIALYFITMSRQTVGHWSAKPCCEIH